MTPREIGHHLELVQLSVLVMRALVAGDLKTASREAGAALTPYLVDQSWLWRIRLEQAAADPSSLRWIARAAVDAETGQVVGHVGFHGPPDGDGMVEVAYSVDPQHRRRGYATAMLRTALEWAASVPAVRTVRASISPDNTASLATLRPFGFEHVGEQWDVDDGLELIFERQMKGEAPRAAIEHPAHEAWSEPPAN
jgi:[ribosomal protein S5]-alanine N-acetyltransferase